MRTYRKQAEGHGANELADTDGTGHDEGWYLEMTLIVKRGSRS